jgi:hypothetical protein
MYHSVHFFWCHFPLRDPRSFRYPETKTIIPAALRQPAVLLDPKEPIKVTIKTKTINIFAPAPEQIGAEKRAFSRKPSSLSPASIEAAGPKAAR